MNATQQLGYADIEPEKTLATHLTEEADFDPIIIRNAAGSGRASISCPRTITWHTNSSIKRSCCATGLGCVNGYVRFGVGTI